MCSLCSLWWWLVDDILLIYVVDMFSHLTGYKWQQWVMNKCWMLIDEFLCKRKVLGKRAPHSFTPPLSVVGVSNNWYQSGPSLQALTSLKEIHRHTNGWWSSNPWWGKLFYMDNRDESEFEGNGSGFLESIHWWMSSFEEQVKVFISKGRKEEWCIRSKDHS